ncbi:hypothetical protein MHBO_002954, partial [Bonamia ostreae]
MQDSLFTETELSSDNDDKSKNEEKMDKEVFVFLIDFGSENIDFVKIAINKIIELAKNILYDRSIDEISVTGFNKSSRKNSHGFKNIDQILTLDRLSIDKILFLKNYLAKISDFKYEKSTTNIYEL